MRDESRIKLTPLQKGLANRKRIFIRSRSYTPTQVVALRHEECCVIDYIAKEEPTYFDFVRNFLLRSDANSTPISQAVPLLFSLRAKGILHFTTTNNLQLGNPTSSAFPGMPIKGKSWITKTLGWWRLTIPVASKTPPPAFYLATFFVALATLVACGIFFWGQFDSYLESFEHLMLKSSALLPMLLPIVVACVLVSDFVRLISASLHGIKTVFIVSRLRAMVLPTIDLDDSDFLFLGRWQALSYCLTNLVTPVLLAVFTYRLGMRYDLPWLLCFSFVFFSLSVLQSSPFFNGAAQKFMQCLSVESHLREKIYTYLTNHIFKLGGLFNNNRIAHKDDEWLPVYAGAALLWLYYVTVAMSDVVIKSASELFSKVFFGETLAIQISASILLLVTACFLFSAIAFLVSIPFQNFNTLMAVPLRKARRRLFDYGKRGHVNREAVIAFLRDIAIFAHLDDQALHILAKKMYPMRISAGKNIINQGEDGHEFFVIADGEADILVKDHLGVIHLVDVLKAGDSFGEIALVKNLPRQATIKAKQNLKLLVLRRSDFDLLYPVGSEMRQGLTQFINKVRLLGECEAFSHLTTRQARQFVTSAQSMTYKKGETIIQQGAEPDFVYLIEHGTVDVRVNAPTSKSIALLERGQVFGMIAVLKSVPRTASVVAVDEVTCLRLTKENFISICLNNLLVATVLSNLTDNQMNELHAFNKVG